ncbi:MAG: prolyl oligopeptidase family serine peptidase [Bacteroidota bacterium]
MSKYLTILLSLMFSAHFSMAQLYDLFKAETYKDGGGNQLLYRFLQPDEMAEGEKYPLIIFLHGAGERGDNNRAQLVHVMKRFVSRDMRSKYPTFIMAPQCPKEKGWANLERGMNLSMKENPTDEGRMIMEVLEEILENYPIDPNRVYIGGLSMGGFGTWDLLARHPEKFAAAFPICGGGDVAQAEKYVGIPIWCFHGADDGVVPAELSRMMIKAIKEKGGNPIYTEFEGTGHDSWNPAFDQNPFVYDWLFSQRKK